MKKTTDIGKDKGTFGIDFEKPGDLATHGMIVVKSDAGFFLTIDEESIWFDFVAPYFNNLDDIGPFPSGGEATAHALWILGKVIPSWTDEDRAEYEAEQAEHGEGEASDEDFHLYLCCRG